MELDHWGQVITVQDIIQIFNDNDGFKFYLCHCIFQSYNKLPQQVNNIISLSSSILRPCDWSILLKSGRPLGLRNFMITDHIHHVLMMKSWKYTKLIPLHKKLSSLEPTNYRPVAILSPLNNILEKDISQQIYEYLTADNIFHPYLHGYRQNRTTMTALILIQMFDKWIRAAAEGQVSGVILLYLCAAFYLVNSQILIRVLKIYGLDKNLLLWIESYMNDSHQ